MAAIIHYDLPELGSVAGMLVSTGVLLLVGGLLVSISFMERNCNSHAICVPITIIYLPVLGSVAGMLVALVDTVLPCVLLLVCGVALMPVSISACKIML